MAIISERIEGKIISVDINSTNIKSATYDTESQVLTVNFNNGGIYEYQSVPWELFAKFRMSDSQGKFLNQHVKGKYSHTKIK
jgi:hypothetical protein